jgi:DNA-binding IscR family transcriptional regulator
MTSLRFSTAIHVLLLLAHKKAESAERAVPSSVLASSIGANPVVVRRTLVSLSEAGLIQTKAGSTGGAWLARSPAKIRASEIYASVEEHPPIGYRKKGNSTCPVGDAAPAIICGLIQNIGRAAQTELSKTTLAQMLRDLEKAAA